MEIILVAALPCAIWAIVSLFRIAGDLERRGMPVSFIWMRFLAFRYLHQYSRITREETGRVGPLLYHFVVPINLALVLVIVFAIAKHA